MVKNEVFAASGLMVSDEKKETVHMPEPYSLRVTATGLSTLEVLIPSMRSSSSKSCAALPSPGTAPGNTPRSSTTTSLEIEVQMLKAEVLRKMLYGCVAWSPNAAH